MPNKAAMKRNEMKTRRIGVLLGGTSAEREVSLRTGEAVYNSLLRSGYEAMKIDAGQDLPQKMAEAGIEVAIICLHGRGGEDGTVQGLLEIMGIPYTGSGVLASSLAIEKITAKQILLHHELPTPGFEVFRKGDDIGQLLKRCGHFPLIVKPSREGSTIGVTIAENSAELEQGIRDALEYDSLVLVEDFIRGSEATVSIVNGQVLPIIEIVPKSGFYDYQSKYTAGQTEYILPARYEPVLYQRIQQSAAEAYAALGCRGAARVDFMVQEREFFCLEVNTVPGMTETSLLPKAAAEAGISFDELVIMMLDDAATGK